MKSQSTKNPVRIIPCGALFESYGQTLDPSKYCPELPEAQCMLAEGVGFEPTIRNYRIPDFESGAFDLSATLPRQERRWIVSALTRKSKAADREKHSRVRRPLYPWQSVSTLLRRRNDLFLAVHVGTQRLRNRHGTIGILIVFQHSHERTADSETGTIEGVNVAGTAVFVLKASAHAASLKVFAIVQELISR